MLHWGYANNVQALAKTTPCNTCENTVKIQLALVSGVPEHLQELIGLNKTDVICGAKQ